KLADITQLVQASGILQARTRVDVGAQVSGQVQTLHVELGQNVKKGDLLVSLDPEIARSDLAQAEAAVAQQKAQLERMKVDIELSQREVQRQQRLLAGSATAGQEAENAQGQLDKLQADYRGQQASMQRLQADLAKRQLNLGYTRITAPMDGTVVNIPVQAGQTVIAVQITPVMVALAQLDTITVRARVPEADVSAVKVGQVARFSTLSGEGRQYEGRVRVIQPVPERMGNAVYYNVLFEVDNKDRSLLSDMTVQVNIETGSAKQVPTLPMVALGERDAQGRYEVQIYKPGSEQDPAHKPEVRKVRIGLQDGGKAQVIEGVKPGEKLLLAPTPKKAGDGDLGVIID
ncbi:MAG TPA: efflux RND transporter periplasmic adaptor subunit, partial [Burkholderiaceae bacterium]|nr:efflux RND transporter periplasmic adaptor subunit [Burkholderiaceae bacterium]